MKTTRTLTLLAALVLLASGPLAAQFREATTYADGSVYSGQRNGKGLRHGEGLMTWPSGDRYEGQFNRWHIEGEGTIRYAVDGSSYSGLWFNDVYEGRGVVTTAGGTTYKGIFKAGQLVQQDE